MASKFAYPNGTVYDATSIPTRLKTLLVCLSILRNLSPKPIVDAVAAIQADDKFITPLVGGAELLRKVFRQERVHLLRNPGSGTYFKEDFTNTVLKFAFKSPAIMKPRGEQSLMFA